MDMSIVWGGGMRGREKDVSEQECRESELYIPSNTTVGGREEREARRRKFIFGGEARRDGRLSRLATVYRLPQRRNLDKTRHVLERTNVCLHNRYFREMLVMNAVFNSWAWRRSLKVKMCGAMWMH